MKSTQLPDKRPWSLGCALLGREDMVADEGEWAARLWAMADLTTPMAVRAAATLRIADHIMGGRRTAPELAEATGADADALDRVLRHLVTAGVLGRDQSDRYVLTAQGQALRDDHPAGMRAMLDLDSAIGRADLSFVQLLHTVRTGEPAFPAQLAGPSGTTWPPTPPGRRPSTPRWPPTWRPGGPTSLRPTTGDRWDTWSTSAAATAHCLPPCSASTQASGARCWSCPAPPRPRARR